MLSDLVVLVTGASSGIGQAIAIAAAHQDAKVCAVGRNSSRLQQTHAAAGISARLVPLNIDLATNEGIQSLCELVRVQFGRLDVLVHSAGVIQHNLMSNALIDDFDRQYSFNLRMPYLLTQSLLPELKAAQGQIVFVNSSLGLTAKRPETGQYAATQHALKAIADSLREEVNPFGVRVVSLFLGRTATPRQENLYSQQGLPYRPDLLMQPEDVAAALISILTLPRTAEVTDISMRPLRKSY
jgi:NAD(P)-dependent dehydrogenase (short-subunit alcohol dehydrogenase family)